MTTIPMLSEQEKEKFDEIPEQENFDLMFWNFPWNAPNKEIEEILEETGEEVRPEKVMQLKAGLDTQYKALSRFMEQSKDRLNPDGEILLGAGAPSRHDIIYGEAERLDYNIEVTAEQEMDVPIVDMPKLKIILYRLTLKTE